MKNYCSLLVKRWKQAEMVSLSQLGSAQLILTVGLDNFYILLEKQVDICGQMRSGQHEGKIYFDTMLTEHQPSFLSTQAEGHGQGK